MLTAAIVLNLGGWWVTLRLFDQFGHKLRFVKFVAVRHLRGRKSGFLTAISLLSILGVSFSSCTLTTVLSVMGGFSNDLKQKILKTNAHIVVDNTGADMEKWQGALDSIRKVEGVKAATPIVQGDLMMNARTNNHGVLLKGIDLASFTSVSSVLSSLEKGDLAYLNSPEKLFESIRLRRSRLYGADQSDDDKDAGPPGGSISIPPPASPKQRVLPAVIIGRELAKTLRLYVGEEVNVISPLGDIGPTGVMPKSRPFRIGGVFFSGMYEFDVG
jgi:lipoprotein-releasing system permease protein